MATRYICDNCGAEIPDGERATEFQWTKTIGNEGGHPIFFEANFKLVKATNAARERRDLCPECAAKVRKTIAAAWGPAAERVKKDLEKGKR